MQIDKQLSRLNRTIQDSKCRHSSLIQFKLKIRLLPSVWSYSPWYGYGLIINSILVFSPRVHAAIAVILIEKGKIPRSRYCNQLAAHRGEKSEGCGFED